jgi:hypothetical protein
MKKVKQFIREYILFPALSGTLCGMILALLFLLFLFLIQGCTLIDLYRILHDGIR